MNEEVFTVGNSRRLSEKRENEGRNRKKEENLNVCMMYVYFYGEIE